MGSQNAVFLPRVSKLCLHTSAVRKPQSTHVTCEAFLSQYESKGSNGYLGKIINHTVTRVKFGGFLSVGAHKLYVSSNYHFEQIVIEPIHSLAVSPQHECINDLCI